MKHPHIAFNTNRMYSDKGQRIAACIVDGRCHFIDIDRGVSGSFEFHGPDDNLTQELVMSNYDHGNYRGGPDDLQINNQLYPLAERV